MEGSDVLGISNVYLQVLILVASILGVAFFSSSEASLLSVSKVRVRHLAEEGNLNAKAVERVVGKHEKFFASILLTENAFIIFASTVGTAMAISLAGEAGSALLLATLLLTVVIVQFGEIIPKTLAARGAERWSLIAARPIEIVMWLETAVLFLFTLLPRMIYKLSGSEIKRWSPFVTEGELRMLIDVAETEGVVETAEAEMLERVFHFGDRQVNEVMTPRTEIIWMGKGSTLEEVLDVYAGQTHTRFPVFHDDHENIVGLLSVKDLLEEIARGKLQSTDCATDRLRPSYFVPETKLVGQLFDEMRDRGLQMAICVDQHGGVAGLVTLKSLLEVIVGPVGEEGEPAEQDYSPIGPGSFDLNAGMSIDEVNEKLSLGLPEGDYQTVAGFILKQLGHIPQEGEVLHYQGISVEVKRMDRVKIERVEVRWPENAVESAATH